MDARIIDITLSNFKGVVNAKYEFNKNNVTITGKNGKGKTTVYTAWLWLLADKDADLKSNPNIRPIDVEECTPRVEATLMIDGRVVTIAKEQKRTVSKPNADGISKIALSNTYEVNSVQKSERDFKSYLSELGFDFDNFLALSHINTFVGDKKDEQRKALMGMASAITDYDLSATKPELVKLTQLLANYSLDEVKSMQKSTLRKINEDYGKNGEILRAKIEGMVASKVEVNEIDLKAKIDALNSQIDKNLAKQRNLASISKVIDEKSHELMTLKFAQGDVVRKENEKIGKERADIEKRIFNLESDLDRTLNEISITKNKIALEERIIETNTKDIEKYKIDYMAVKNLKLKDEELTCPMCNRPYDVEKAEEIKATYEQKKIDNLNHIIDLGNNAKKSLTEAKQRRDELIDKLATLSNSEVEINNQIDELKANLKSIPLSVDGVAIKEYVELGEKISDLESELKTLQDNSILDTLKAEEKALREEQMGYSKELSKVSVNKEIDERIEQTKALQSLYEQNRAKAEEILYQADILDKCKNEVLTEEINKHFNLVKFELFEYQKNGEYKTTCNAYIDGKKLGESTNTGRELLAKLDIARGLQNFYNKHYPVFVDGMECLSSDSKARMELESQLIGLEVSEDDKLTVKEI